MTGTAATWPLNVALAEAITDDAALQTLLGGDMVYSGSVPRDVDFDYVVIKTGTESEWAAFVDGGSNCVTTLNFWCAGDDLRRASILFGELHRVLNRVLLGVDGFKPCVYGELALVDISTDPGNAYVHGVARYTATLFRA